ncbi:MAG: hypothetical protein BWK76_02995 [Desulfobulbaceae bacterium A2]|nr:MAG: hypothetical protein BWK76_02995 [Desulfobulbaceae bacterium A2]
MAETNKKLCTAAQDVSTSGFTLLEVLVAMAVLALALTTLLGTQARSLSLMREGRCQLVAATLAQDMLARRARSGSISLPETGEFVPDHPGYSWRIQGEDLSLPTPLNSLPLQRLSVRVEGPDKGRCVHEIRTLVTGR